MRRLRIFCAIRHSRDPKQFYGGLWSGNFYPALRELRHEIIESQVDLLPTSRFMHIAGDFTAEEAKMREQTTGQILSELRSEHLRSGVDVFLSYFYNAHFDPSGFDEIRRLGIPSVNFYCNSIYQFPFVADIAAKVDYSWHAERDARASYLAVGANPIWVQMGADPNVYRPIPGMARQPKACFVGQRYADRDRWMAALVRAEIPLEIYGPGWGAPATSTVSNNSTAPDEPQEYLGRPLRKPGTIASYVEAMRETISENGMIGGCSRILKRASYRRKTSALSPLFMPFARGSIPFEKIAEVFAAHEVCLNFSNVWADGNSGSALIPHVRLRDFEAPMCRTCYLTSHTDEIAEFYEIGKEIDTYRSDEELVDKTRFYLTHSAEAERLRTAGYQRALRDHNWVRRFEELFAKMGIATAGKST